MPTKAREEIDNPWRRVFCLEGAWNGDDLRDRSSVLPVLDVLERLEHIEYIHRDVGTRAELEHYVRRWWDEGLDYRVLYFAFHGTTEDSGSRALLLSHETDGTVTIDHLTGLFVNKLQDCVVHFGSCSIFGPDDRAIDTFRERTGARAVTGYARDVGWIDSAAWELALLAVLADYKQLGTALNRLQDDKYRTLRDSLGFKVVRG